MSLDNTFGSPVPDPCSVRACPVCENPKETKAGDCLSFAVAWFAMDRSQAASFICECATRWSHLKVWAPGDELLNCEEKKWASKTHSKNNKA